MNTLTNLFNNIPIFWINLNDTIDRKDKMIERLKDYNHHYRVEAVDGRNPQHFKTNYNVNYTSKINFNTALIAVICSHIKAIKQGYDLQYETICVLEDDANFELIQYYPHTLIDIINKTNDNWEIIQLYCVEEIDQQLNNYKENGLNTFKRTKYKSGTCYLINRNGMKKILDNVVNTNGIDYFDIKIPIINPEELIFSNLNAYILNLPFLYYYDEKMTFDTYTNNKNDIKKQCQIIQYNAKNILISFYEKNLIIK